jgi:hypothetical protein
MTLPALPIRPRNFTDPVPNQPFFYEEKPMLKTGSGNIEVGQGLEFDPENSTLSTN